MQLGGKDLFSLCPWLGILAPKVSRGVVISEVCLFTAPTGKTGIPGLRFIEKLRLFFGIFTFDLLARTVASASAYCLEGSLVSWSLPS